MDAMFYAARHARRYRIFQSARHTLPPPRRYLMISFIISVDIGAASISPMLFIATLQANIRGAALLRAKPLRHTPDAAQATTAPARWRQIISTSRNVAHT